MGVIQDPGSFIYDVTAVVETQFSMLDLFFSLNLKKALPDP